MRKNGIEPIIEFVIKDISEEDAHWNEQYLIMWYGRKDLDKGPLLNMTNGGEGVKGLVRSEEAKRKSGQNNPNNGKPRPEEVKEKIRKSIAKNPRTPWNKGKTGVQIYKPKSRESIEIVAKKNTGSKRTEEQRQRMALAQKKRFSDPAQHEAMSLAKQRANNE
jgi:hypothetical protein